MAVVLPAGETVVSRLVTAPEEPWAVMALAHGAGAGMTHPFLAGAAEAAAGAGIAVVRFQFPYLEAGRRMPGPAAHAIATWAAVAAAVAVEFPGVPLVAAGKSYGGRMASMAAAEGAIAPDALVYLGYPLHPPGKSEALRVAHLPAVTAPQLFVSGSADPFVQPLADLEAAVASCPDAQLHLIDRGGHSFEVAGARRDAAEVGASLMPDIAGWLRTRLGRPSG
ncbi:dienelactone hydrolase family protein [Microbacterium sp. W1N]|uniref:alpha/beta hydrolase family protein n=1 Tax=Microbacterium festucae TaxID=2977531 RepID=UPI0021BE33C8|nr:alpha/beta family hydrolase [Microbacterium festucae]MCT9820452.1 dienelactone hydrolase family protein [Microbacterium festucae]